MLQTEACAVIGAFFACVVFLWCSLLYALIERAARKSFIVERKLENNFQEWLLDQPGGKYLKGFRGF